jgi:hypothetical protein
LEDFMPSSGKWTGKAATLLCLSLTMMGAFPRGLRAEDGRAVPAATSMNAIGLATVDYERFVRDGTSGPGVAAPGALRSAGPSAQATSGWSSYSGAKKTWIVVGIVAGAALVVVAVSHHSGGGSSGGGGY